MLDNFVAIFSWFSTFVLDLLRSTILGYFFLLLIVVLAIEFIFNFLKEVSL